MVTGSAWWCRRGRYSHLTFCAFLFILTRLHEAVSQSHNHAEETRHINFQGDIVVSNQNPLKDIKINSSNLYREESITDLQAGTIKQMIPVTVDGSCDESRTTMFVGVTQLMSANGPLPIQCELPGTTLAEAIASFPAEINKAVEKLIEEAKRMQREAANRIVVPGQEQGGKIIT